MILTFLSTQFRTKSDEENIRECFEFLDINKKGFVTAENLFLVLRVNTQWKEENIRKIVQEIFETIDLNKDGKIEHSEFLIANLDWERILSVHKLQFAFARFDNVLPKIYI